jgi:hypothetical protein
MMNKLGRGEERSLNEGEKSQNEDQRIPSGDDFRSLLADPRLTEDHSSSSVVYSAETGCRVDWRKEGTGARP